MTAPISTRSSGETADLKELMFWDHRRIEEQLAGVLDALRAADGAAARRRWAALEQGLLEHFDLEEREIFPRFARVDAGEAIRLASEHAALRGEIADLGDGLELHMTRLEAVEAFGKRLSEHAAREGMQAYRWAGQDLPGHKRRELVHLVAAAIKRFENVML